MVPTKPKPTKTGQTTHQDCFDRLTLFFVFFSLTVRNLTTEQKHLSRAHTTWVSGWLNPNLPLHTIRGEIWGKSLAGPRLSDIVSLQRCSSHIRATLMTLNMFDIYKLRLMTGPCLDLEEPVTGMSSSALTQWTWGRIVMPCVKTSGNGLSIHHKEQWWWRLKHSFSIKSAVTCVRECESHTEYIQWLLGYHIMRSSISCFSWFLTVLHGSESNMAAN